MSGKYTYLKLTCLLLGLFRFSYGQGDIGERDDCFLAGQLPIPPGRRFSDNLSCPNLNQNELECYPQEFLCDGSDVCFGGSDEGENLVSLDCDGSLSGRGIPTFVCTPGENIDIDLLCDGVRHCTNGDDETTTLCENKCLVPYYGGCPLSRECLSSEFDVNCGACLNGFITDPTDPGGPCLPIIFITLQQAFYVTSEDDPFVQVCAEVVNDPADLPGGQVFVATLQASPQSASLADFVDNTPVDFEFSSTQLVDCVNIPIVDDTIVEGDEIFLVFLSTLDIQVQIGPISSANVLIEDNDFVLYEFTQPQYTQSEDGGFLVATIQQVAGTLSGPITIVVVTSDRGGSNDAAAGSDYVMTSVTLSFAAGSAPGAQQDINVPIIDDNFVEVNELFDLSATTTSSQVDFTQNGDMAIGVITDDDALLVGFELPSYTFPELIIPQQICLVTRNNAQLLDTINVVVTSASGTATVSLDFQPISMQVGFGPGTFQACFPVQILEDDLSEGEECFTVNAQSTDPNLLLIAPGEEVATVCIADDDRISFELQTQDVGEAAGFTQACVELTSSSLLRDVVVDIQTVAIGSALAGGVDYTGVTTTLTFTSGATVGAEMCINIPINNDLLVENTENFQVVVASDPNVMFDPASGSAIINILDDDMAIFQFTQPEYREDEDNSPLVAGIQLVSGTLTFPITVQVQSMQFTGVGDAASVNLDYQAFGQLFIFAAGSSPGLIQDISVILVNDLVVEPDETFELVATIPSTPANQAGFTQGGDQALGIIQSDVVLSVGFEFPTYTTMEGIAFQQVCLVTRNNAQLSTAEAVVSVSTSNGVAIAGLDYDSFSGTVTFTAGVNRMCVNIGIIDDDDPENQECFSVNAATTNPNIVTIEPGQQQSMVCINDDDLISFDVQTMDTMEGDGSTSVCLQLTAPILPREVTIDVATTGLGSAIAGQDYTSVGSTLTFSSGQTNVGPGSLMCVNIPIIDDVLCELQESFEVSVASDPNVRLNGQPGGLFGTFISLLDNDDGVVSWTAPSYSEQEDNSPLIATLQLIGCTLTFPAIISVNTQNIPNSAVAGVDYIALVNQIVTFGAGSVSGTQVDIPVGLIDDLFAESTESFDIQASTSTPQISVGLGDTIGNIIDDDVCSVAFEMSPYNLIEGPGDMTQEVCLSKINNVILQQPAVVIVATANREKTAGLDYVAFSGTVTFQPGVNRQCVTLQLLDDDEDEPDECLIVRATSQSSSLTIAPVPNTNSPEALVCCIDDDENMFGFEFPSIDVPEQGPPGECCVILEDGTLARSLSITVSTQDGTAIGGQDFIPGPFAPTLNFPAQSGPGTRRCLQTSVINDNQVEAQEFYTLTLSATDPSVVFIPGRDTKIVNIIEDPNDVVNICLQPPTVDTVSEGDSSHLECVQITGLQNRLEKSVTLTLGTSNGPVVETDAQDPMDYIGGNQVLVFNPNNQNNPLCVDIPIVDDAICEDDESFFVNLMSNDDCVSINQALCTGTVIISDNDVATVRSTQPSYSVNEGETLEIDIQLFGQKGPGRECIVSVSTIDGTALSTVMWRDYFALPPTTLTFDSSNTLESIFINVCDDSKCEGDEEFEVILSTSSDGCTVDNTPIPVTIIDDEVDTHGMGDDPHFSIALPSGELLCYTVQGEHGFSFNLISNHKMAMNAKFVPDARRPEVTWLGSIGIIVQNTNYKGSNETKLRFDVDKKSIYIGDKVELEARNIEKLIFSNGKLTISEAPPKEGFHYPSVYVDLEDVQLQFTVKFTNQHLDIYWHSTGGRLVDSHGLIGQFFRKGVEIDEVRKFLIMPNKEPIPVMRRPVWSFMEREMPDEQLCWTAMNPGYQGEGLIDGTYFDYLVDDVLSTDFKFEK